MDEHNHPARDKGTVCGQAHTVFNNLVRTSGIPVSLSLAIEEILERAWETAYRREIPERRGTVITPIAWRQRKPMR